MAPVQIPLAGCADALIGALASASSSAAIADLDGTTLLGERAMLAGFSIPHRRSAGGGCHLFEARDGHVALSLARPFDRELLPALFATDSLDSSDDRAIAAHIAANTAVSLVERGRLLGLAIAADCERFDRIEPVTQMTLGASGAPRRHAPRVVDLSALWAGPLASHLLSLTGAEVIKVESRTRPDAMRDGEQPFFALLNQGKASVVLNFNDANERRALLRLIDSADIVIEAARPRALRQLGIDADDVVRRTAGLTWVTITGHGVRGDAENWIGFGDDCGVAGGLTAALRDASGHAGFVGDAIADPLTGLFAALTAWRAWASGKGGRFAIAMSHVVAQCLEQARTVDPHALRSALAAWHRAAGQRFPTVRERSIGRLPAFGADTQRVLAELDG